MCLGEHKRVRTEGSSISYPGNWATHRGWLEPGKELGGWWTVTTGPWTHEAPILGGTAHSPGRGWGGGTDSSSPVDSTFLIFSFLLPSFQTRNGRSICADPGQAWVQKYIKYLDQTPGPRDLGTVGPSQSREHEKKPQSHLPSPTSSFTPDAPWASPGPNESPRLRFLL